MLLERDFRFGWAPSSGLRRTACLAALSASWLVVGCAAGGPRGSASDGGMRADSGATPADAGPRVDARAVDAGPGVDAASTDAGMFVATDAGVPIDAGAPVDAGRSDAGATCRGDIDCNDGVTCTLDRCMGGACMHLPADADGDGHIVSGCSGGDDCNDMASAVHPGATEVCDGVDNDCSGMADDAAGFECVLGSLGAACTTACSTAGTQVCNAVCRRGPCYAAAEVCGNMCDDTGDGMVDEGCGMSPANDTCTSAVDVTANGTFMGNTCGADDTLLLGVPVPPGCDTPAGGAGTPDVFYMIRTRPAGSSYRLTITPGFVIQFVPSVCTGNGGCGPYRSSMDFTIGGGGGTIWYFAIERSGGGCGAFSLSVTGS